MKQLILLLVLVVTVSAQKPVDETKWTKWLVDKTSEGVVSFRVNFIGVLENDTTAWYIQYRNNSDTESCYFTPVIYSGWQQLNSNRVKLKSGQITNMALIKFHDVNTFSVKLYKYNLIRE